MISRRILPGRYLLWVVTTLCCGLMLLHCSGFNIFSVKYHVPVEKKEVQTRELPPPPKCELERQQYFYSQGGEDIIVFSHFFSNPLRCGGTFVEMGALDGLRFSVSLYYERYLGWKGLLIEANPVNYQQVLKNRPNTTAFGVAAGVCPGGAINFTGESGNGKIIDEAMNPVLKAGDKPIIRVPCVPLGELIRRSGIHSIDLFILDVEGAEYSALKTMDWSIPVKVWIVEMNKSVEKDIVDLFAENGYEKDKLNFKQECTAMLPDMEKNPLYMSKPNHCAASSIFVKK